MGKRNSLPDFHELCAPEQNHIADVISLELFFFFLCSVGGFLWEVLLMYAQEGHYVNRGFLYGPWLPVYGTGAVLFHALLAPRPLLVDPFSDSTDCATFSMRQQKKWRFRSHLRRFIVLFFLSALFGSIIEFAVGYFLAVTGASLLGLFRMLYEFRRICLHMVRTRVWHCRCTLDWCAVRYFSPVLFSFVRKNTAQSEYNSATAFCTRLRRRLNFSEQRIWCHFSVRAAR